MKRPAAKANIIKFQVLTFLNRIQALLKLENHQQSFDVLKQNSQQKYHSLKNCKAITYESAITEKEAQNLFFWPEVTGTIFSAPNTQPQPCFKNSHQDLSFCHARDLERGSEEGKEKHNGEERRDEVVDDHETSSDFCRRDLLEEQLYRQDSCKVDLQKKI